MGKNKTMSTNIMKSLCPRIMQIKSNRILAAKTLAATTTVNTNLSKIPFN